MFVLSQDDCDWFFVRGGHAEAGADFVVNKVFLAVIAKVFAMTFPALELRSTLSEVLGHLLSPDQDQRRLAEQQLKALQVTEGEMKQVS